MYKEVTDGLDRNRRTGDAGDIVAGCRSDVNREDVPKQRRAVREAHLPLFQVKPNGRLEDRPGPSEPCEHTQVDVRLVLVVVARNHTRQPCCRAACSGWRSAQSAADRRLHRVC